MSVVVLAVFFVVTFDIDYCVLTTAIYDCCKYSFLIGFEVLLLLLFNIVVFFFIPRIFVALELKVFQTFSPP